METKTYPPNTSANSFGKHCTFGRVQHFVTLWTVAHQAPLSMGFSRQEHWSRLPFPSPGDLPDPGIKSMSPVSPALQANSLPLSHQEAPSNALFYKTLCDFQKFMLPLRLNTPVTIQWHTHNSGLIYSCLCSSWESFLMVCGLANGSFVCLLISPSNSCLQAILFQQVEEGGDLEFAKTYLPCLPSLLP